MTSEFSDEEIKKMSPRDRVMAGFEIYEVPGNPNTQEAVEKRQRELEPLEELKKATKKAEGEYFGDTQGVNKKKKRSK